ncbi:MAG: hypothetical protein WCF67_12820 [Chitinophagaceae bacterium]
MKRILIFLLALAPPVLSAQVTKKKNCSCSFSSINQVGLLEGSDRSSFNLQTINGLRYKTWFAGAGVGLDKYHTRSIPVFFDLRKDLLKKWNTPFIYGDIGVNLPWTKKSEDGWWLRSEFDRGAYYDAGIGYKLNLGKGRALLFSGGFSLKKMRETRFVTTTCPFVGPCPEIEGERYDFTFKRFSVKAGLQL